MQDLRRALAGGGYEDVETLGSSGNVILGSSDPEQARRDIESLLASAFGLEVSVVVRTSPELGAIVAANPFPDLATSEPRRLHVVFLSTAPEAEALGDLPSSDDELVLRGRELYLAYGEAGAGRSPLNLAQLERRLGVSATARNWNTVLRVVDAVRVSGGRCQAELASRKGCQAGSTE